MQPERIDERDTMFARMARCAGTPAYEDYYARRPELREGDDRLRARPDLCRPGGIHYDPAVARETVDWFTRIAAIKPDPDEVEGWAKRLRAAPDPTTGVRAMLLALGAVAAGAAPIRPGHVYTHKGRFDADYGRPVELDHPFAAVFLVEMDYRAMRQAPRAPTIRESARQYYRAARIALVAAAALRAAGFAAKAHYDAHYDVILPPLAVLAGLGEVGRNNILVADRFGSRVRIGAVTTDAPLRPGGPVDLGVARFCGICRKCAENCPSRALSLGEREEVRGVAKWPTHVERCYGYWRRAGTDCGVCMACCPFSHRDNWFHRAVRMMIRRWPWSHRIALWGEHLLYGRGWKPKES